jgi:hypothetical protein
MKKGRPTGGAKIGPAELQEIRTLVLQAKGPAEIALRLTEAGTPITKQGVHYWIKNVIRPEIEREAKTTVHIEVAKLNLIESEAWDRFRANGTDEVVDETAEHLINGGIIGLRKIVKKARPEAAVWLQTVLDCIDKRCRILGYYSATRVDHEVGFRVAGMTPDEVDQEMLERLAKRLEEQRQIRDLAKSVA